MGLSSILVRIPHSLLHGRPDSQQLSFLFCFSCGGYQRSEVSAHVIAYAHTLSQTIFPTAVARLHENAAKPRRCLGPYSWRDIILMHLSKNQYLLLSGVHISFTDSRNRSSCHIIEKECSYLMHAPVLVATENTARCVEINCGMQPRKRFPKSNNSTMRVPC